MPKIMIVDDHSDIVDTLKMIMEKEGHSTETAFSGDEFIKKVSKYKPDLVLLDVMMPGLTTKEILEKLKEKKLSKLKIILVTVVRFSEEEKVALLKDSNIVDYVTKPFDIIEIVKTVSKHIKKR